MSIESASSTAAERLAEFEAMLASALEDAKRREYDLPSRAALTKARELFSGLAAEFSDTHPFEVDVTIDGAVEVSAGNTRVTVTIDVAPGGDRIDAVTGHHDSKSVTWVAKDPSIQELIAEIRRAA